MRINLSVTGTTYRVRVQCGNCGRVYKPEIAKGTLVKDHPCDRCGVKMLETHVMMWKSN